MKTIAKYIKPKAGIIAFEMIIKLLGTAVELLLPWMLSVILDRYVPVKDLHGILVWGVGMILCAALALGCNVAANRISCSTSRDITRKVRGDLFAKVTRLSCRQEDTFTIPSLISRLTSDTYNLHQMLDRMQRLGVRAPILLLGGIAVTFTMEPVLTLVLIGALPILGVVVWFVSTRGIRMYTRTQQALDGMIRRAQESLTGIRVVQALSKAEYESRRFDEANVEVAQREYRANLLMNLTNPAMNLTLNTGLTLMILVGAYRVNAGVTQPSTIIAFLSYFTIILNALMMVSRLFVMYSKGVASAQRIAEILDAPDEPVTQPDSGKKQEDDFIRFDHVSFAYDKVGKDLDDISFSLKKGQTLGIIGPTGSGKSTLLALLLRFYDPDAGQIRIGGRNLEEIDPALLHSIFGVVFQNDFLFAGEIGENIDFVRGVTQERMKRAAKTAQAEFIEPRGGFASVISSRGADLSGGQKQRLLLARAMAADPEILLLDDSSSALDYKTDAALRAALARDFSQTTKIIVAQRVSSIRGADKILVLEDGKAVGYGSHDELMRSCESYREIAEIQMGEVE